MSRIGKAPIDLPAGVEFKIDNNWVTIKGPKGSKVLSISDKIFSSQVKSDC